MFQHGLSLTGLFTYLSLSASFGLVVGLVLLRPLIKLKLSFDPAIAKYLFRQSLAMGALFSLYSLYTRIDILLLERFKGVTAVGIYGLSYKVYENFALGAGFLANATFPLLSARAANPALFKQAFEKYLAGLLTLSLLASSALLIAAPLIVQLLAGPAFAPAVTPLRLLSLALVGSYLGHATGYALIALNRQFDGLKVVFASFILDIGLNLVFIPRYSYIAPAFVTLITELTAFVVGLFFLRRHLAGINLVSGLRALTPARLLQALKI